MGYQSVGVSKWLSFQMFKLKYLPVCLLLASSGCMSDKNSTFAKPAENPATGRYVDSEANRENHKKMVEWAIQNEAKDWKQGKRGGEGGGLTWESFWADRFKAYEMYDDNPSWSKQYVRERRRELGLPPLKI